MRIGPFAIVALVVVPAVARADVPHLAPGPTLAPAAEAPLFERERERYMDGRRVFLSSLLVWGGTSTVAGASLVAFPRDSFAQWYGAQTIAWGLVNGTIAVVGLVTTSEVRRELSTRERVFAERRAMQRFLWVNVALDVLYVTTGALLLGLGESPAVRGNGAAILSQGGFLVGFDLLGSFTQGPRAPLSLE